MKTLILSLSSLAFAGSLLLAASPASAMQACTTHDDAAKRLETQFDEKVIGRGLANAGKTMIELFVSQGGTWTVVVSAPDGKSCILASGDSWHDLPVLAGDPV